MNSFYLNVQNHLDGKMTGPYHTILSLYDVLRNYEDFKYSVKINKEKYLILCLKIYYILRLTNHYYVLM